MSAHRSGSGGLARLTSALGLRVSVVVLVMILLALVLGDALPGEQLVYASALDGDLDLYLLDTARGITRNLTNNPENDSQPAWSPDGTQLAFVSDRGGNRDIYTMDVGCRGWLAVCGSRQRRLTTHPAVDFDPAWSPDGAWLAYTSERFGYAEILVMPSAGGVPRRLTHNDNLDANPAWSPDGTQIVFASDQGERWNTDLYLMDVNGENVRHLLADPNNESSPAWSPDGHRLLFVTGNAARRQLALLDLETAAVTLLLDARGSEDLPTWSPDGESIALLSFRAGVNSEVYTLRLDCTGAPEDCLRRLTFNSVLELDPQFRPR